MDGLDENPCSVSSKVYIYIPLQCIYIYITLGSKITNSMTEKETI